MMQMYRENINLYFKFKVIYFFFFFDETTGASPQKSYISFTYKITYMYMNLDLL